MILRRADRPAQMAASVGVAMALMGCGGAPSHPGMPRHMRPATGLETTMLQGRIAGTWYARHATVWFERDRYRMKGSGGFEDRARLEVRWNGNAPSPKPSRGGWEVWCLFH